MTIIKKTIPSVGEHVTKPECSCVAYRNINGTFTQKAVKQFL